MMKHPTQETIKILLWLFAAVFTGLWMTKLVATMTRPQETIGATAFILLVVGMMLVGAVFWWLMMKHATRMSVIVVYIIGMSVMIARGLLIWMEATKLSSWVILVVRFGVAIIIAIFYFKLVQKMKSSWFAAKRLTWISNILSLFGIVTIAAYIASDVKPWVAMVILLLVSFYDAWAVWKSRTMVKMANFFVEQRLFPGIAVPYHDRMKFALLGGGDVFFIVFVAGAFLKNGILSAVLVAGGMVAAVTWLFLFSEKDKFYPALPFIFVGAVVGVVLTWLL